MKPKKLKITIKRFPSGAVAIGLNRTLITREEEKQFMDMVNDVKSKCSHVLKVDEDDYRYHICIKCLKKFKRTDIKIGNKYIN